MRTIGITRRRQMCLRPIVQTARQLWRAGTLADNSNHRVLAHVRGEERRALAPRRVQTEHVRENSGSRGVVVEPGRTYCAVHFWALLRAEGLPKRISAVPWDLS